MATAPHGQQAALLLRWLLCSPGWQVHLQAQQMGGQGKAVCTQCPPVREINQVLAGALACGPHGHLKLKQIRVNSKGLR